MSRPGARARARAGATAYANSPRRYAPLRAVVGWGQDTETLECGHVARTLVDMIGVTAPSRRRCLACLTEACANAGHPFDVSRGGADLPTCRCGDADGAMSHLIWYHGARPCAASSGLAADLLHSIAHVADLTTRPHWHVPSRHWEVRTRPQGGHQ